MTLWGNMQFREWNMALDEVHWTTWHTDKPTQNTSEQVIFSIWIRKMEIISGEFRWWACHRSTPWICERTTKSCMYANVACVIIVQVCQNSYQVTEKLYLQVSNVGMKSQGHGLLSSLFTSILKLMKTFSNQLCQPLTCVKCWLLPQHIGITNSKKLSPCLTCSVYILSTEAQHAQHTEAG